MPASYLHTKKKSPQCLQSHEIISTTRDLKHSYKVKATVNAHFRLLLYMSACPEDAVSTPISIFPTGSINKWPVFRALTVCQVPAVALWGSTVPQCLHLPLPVASL